MALKGADMGTPLRRRTQTLATVSGSHIEQQGGMRCPCPAPNVSMWDARKVDPETVAALSYHKG